MIGGIKVHMFATRLFIILISICAPNIAFAYVDPNTGGYIFQSLFPVITAIVAGYLFFKNQIKNLFYKLKRLFKRDNG